MSTVTCPRCQAPIPTEIRPRACPQCGFAFGDDEPELIATRSDEPQRPPPAPEDIQALFPHLEIIGLIGRGGMGAVYEARQRGLNRRVALKLLWAPSTPDAGFEQRFAREGRALAQLAHPNVVAVHDAGRSGPYYWLVMEYVDGPNLRALMKAGRIEPARALGIVMQMCAALDYAHKRGIVHRDIKPENILIMRSGRVKVADFGLAKVLARQHLSPAITRSEQAMGTPHYIAPEQIEHPKEVDHRADIYSLGVVLYEALTGELPLGRWQLPSRKAQLDVRLDEIVVKALQKQPEQRYQSASEVSTAIRSVSEGKVPGRSRASGAVRRKSGAWPVIAGACAALLGVWWFTSRSGVEAGPSEVASTPEERFEKGRALVARPETLQAGIIELEAAYEHAPSLVGLRASLSRSLEQAVEGLKAQRKHDEAVPLARRARELSPSAEADERLRSTLELARSAWAEIVVIDAPAEGQVLSDRSVLVRGHVVDLPAGARLAIRGAPVDVFGATFEHPLGTLEDGPQAVELTVTTPSELDLHLVRAFVIDTRPPELTLTAPGPNGVVRESFAVHGTVVDASRTRISVGERSVVKEQGGEWSLDLRLAAGRNDLEVTAEDAHGRKTTQAFSVVVDTSPPVVLDPGHGFDIAWSLRDDGIVVRVADDKGLGSASLDGRPVAIDASGSVKLTPGSADEGVEVSHTLVVTDVAGNETEQEIVLRRDDTKPKIGPGPEIEDVFPDSTHILRGTFSDRSRCTFVLDDDGTELENGEFAIPISVSPGRKPGETIPVNFAIHDEARNRTTAQRTLAVIAPCTACEPVDGKRGECTACKGKGAVSKGCRKCNAGETEVDCSLCEATGKAACPTCHGSGKGQMVACGLCSAGRVACAHCEGSGTVSVDCRNPSCNGGRVWHVGLPSGKWVTCNTCNGTTKQPAKCGPCSGSKTMPCNKCDNGWRALDCPHCDEGRVGAPCAECEGSGRLTAECQSCKGAGEKSQRCWTCKATGDCATCGGTGRADRSANSVLQEK